MIAGSFCAASPTCARAMRVVVVMMTLPGSCAARAKIKECLAAAADEGHQRRHGRLPQAQRLGQGPAHGASAARPGWRLPLPARPRQLANALSEIVKQASRSSRASTSPIFRPADTAVPGAISRAPRHRKAQPRRRRHRAQHLPYHNLIADFDVHCDRPVGRCTQHPLRAFAGDDARRARVRQRRAVVDDAAQRMAALRFNDGVAVHARSEAGTQTNNQRRLGDRRVDVALGQPRIDHGEQGAASTAGARARGRARPARESGPDGARPPLPPGSSARLAVQRFDQDFAFQHGRGQGHAAADDQRPLQLQHQHRETRLMQAIDNARCPDRRRRGRRSDPAANDAATCPMSTRRYRARAGGRPRDPASAESRQTTRRSPHAGHAQWPGPA